MIKKPQVALFTDLHLGIYGNSPDWHNIAREWADWIVNELKSKNIRDILFLGDWFHNRSEISVHTLDVAAEILNKFRDFNIFMIVGNHDAYYKNRSDVHSLRIFQGYDNVVIVDRILDIDAYGKKLTFVPWNADISEIDKADYIFGHFEIQSFKMNNFKVCDHGWHVSDFLKSKTDTVFSGHFHNRNSSKYKEGSIHYIGNTFPMDFSDAENIKGYHLLDIKTGKLDFYENTISPRFKKIKLSNVRNIKPEDVERNVIKLVVDKELDDDKLDRIKTYLFGMNPFRLEVEYDLLSAKIDSKEEVESGEITQMFTDFIGQMGFDEDKLERVQKIVTALYEKNSL